jgi:hypothetical protein
VFVGSHRGSVEPIISSGGVHPIRKSPPAAFRALPKYFAQAGRIAQRLNVPLGKTPVHTGDGWAGKKVYVSPRRHWALTNSRPSANVTLIILRVADLAAALLEAFLRIMQGGSGSSQTSMSVTATEVRMSFFRSLLGKEPPLYATDHER